MRNFIFRGKSRETKEWLVGDLINYGSSKLIAPLDGDWFDFIGKTRLPKMKFDIIVETLTFNLPKIDVNGKMIFGGDIVSYQWQRGKTKKGTAICEIVWDASLGMWKLGINETIFQDFAAIRLVDMTVLGNKWDNAELIKNNKP